MARPQLWSTRKYRHMGLPNTNRLAQPVVDESVSLRLRYSDPIFGFEEQEVGFDLEGRLVLIDPCCDGFAYTWTRFDGDG